MTSQESLREQLSPEADTLIKYVTPFLRLNGFDYELVEENYIKIVPKRDNVTVYRKGGESIERDSARADDT